MVDYAHNEAGMTGLIELLRGLRPPGGRTWLAICTAGDRTEDLLRGFAFERRSGRIIGIADLLHYLRGRYFARTSSNGSREGAREAGVNDVPRPTRTSWSRCGP